MTTTITVERRPGQDAAQLAAETAKASGTKLSGNLRWYGLYGPTYRAIPTRDGRTIIIREPVSRCCEPSDCSKSQKV